MKQHGGKILVSIRRLQPDPFGSKATRDRWVRRKQQPTCNCNPTRIELRPRPDRARFRNRHRQSGGDSVLAEPLDSFKGQIQKPRFLESGSQRCKDVAVSKFVGLDQAVYSQDRSGQIGCILDAGNVVRVT